jgi:2-methylcitrate dehydratase PrpD
VSDTTAQVIGRWAADFSLDDAPPEVVDAAVDALVNAVGAVVGGTRLPNAQTAIELAIRDGAGEDGVMLIGDGRRAAPTYALFANGVMGNTLGHEETHVGCAQHPVTTTFPIAIAFAERYGRSGRDLLEAVLVGAEVTVAVAAMELTPAVKYVNCEAPAVYGTIGSTAAAAKLAGLDAAGIAKALALATNFCSGLSQSVRAGTSEYQFAVGHGSSHAYTAVSLALADSEAALASFEGEGGFYGLFGAASDEDLAAHDVAGDVAGRLGREWAVTELIYKPYPVHFFNEAFIDGARRLREENGITGDDVQKVRLTIDPLAAASGGLNLGPLEGRGGVAGSTGFGVAAMLVRGKVGLAETEDFAAEDIVAVMGRTEIEVVEELGTAKIDLVTSSGELHFEAGIGDDYHLKGEQIDAIFRNAAGNLLDEDAVERLLGRLRAVKDVPKAGELLDLMHDGAA